MGVWDVRESETRLAQRLGGNVRAGHAQTKRRDNAAATPLEACRCVFALIRRRGSLKQMRPHRRLRRPTRCDKNRNVTSPTLAGRGDVPRWDRSEQSEVPAAWPTGLHCSRVDEWTTGLAPTTCTSYAALARGLYGATAGLFTRDPERGVSCEPIAIRR